MRIRTCVLLVLLIIHSIPGYNQSIVLIEFDEDNEGVYHSDLGQIEIRLASELNKKFKVITKSKDAWKVENTYREKREFVTTHNAQYSVELKYESISKEVSVEFKNWMDESFDLPPKCIRKERLSNNIGIDHLQALAIEWSRDATYFINNNIQRPEIAIKKFIQNQEVVNPKVIDLMSFLKSKLPLYYLDNKISWCIRLKQSGGLFDECTSMTGHYWSKSELFDITVEFENLDGRNHKFTLLNLHIPKYSDYGSFTSNFIDKIDWPENLHCNE